MHKRPARLTHLCKIRASRQTKRFGQKLGIYAKDYTPDKLKTRKGDLGKKGYHVGLKTRKGDLGKKGFPDGLKTRKGGPGKS